ncbi:MAG: L,D-transpeptidase [Verrucomicrobia bacterium]|nr:L,D-transpeptidase [Verrucomicrobiota bacterium]
MNLRTACEAQKIEVPEDAITVSVGEHKLKLWHQGSVVLQFDCSTSKNPVCNIEGSLGTPLGLHRIAQKIGANQPQCMVFQARVPTGVCYGERADAGHGQKALVTTRILWLDGLQPGFNKGGNLDSMRRFIYIHGSNLQQQIPTPLSAGCVLLRDPDLIQLFDSVAEGTLVWISP